jgi:hypothetical protein
VKWLALYKVHDGLQKGTDAEQLGMPDGFLHGILAEGGQKGLVDFVKLVLASEPTEAAPTASGPCRPSRRSDTSWRSSGPGSTICADDLGRGAVRSPQGRESPSASASLSSPRSTVGLPWSVLSLLRSGDFLETLPVALDELKGFVEPIL